MEKKILEKIQKELDTEMEACLKFLGYEPGEFICWKMDVLTKRDDWDTLTKIRMQFRLYSQTVILMFVFQDYSQGIRQDLVRRKIARLIASLEPPFGDRVDS